MVEEKFAWNDKDRLKAIFRIFVMIVGVVNAILTAKGINPIPFDESQVAEVCSYIFAGLMAVWSWWKDAPITDEAIMSHRWLMQLKGKE